ncbi:MAG TPA: UDP-N-acetylmuramate dehydrogenase [Dehalococcoidia bacterium]|jgi:UDP-N-acetylmuramate dehydrogenase|nr:UDP-N-acetylmuramate dehydrogenase [Dehalococcoidia bacterium]
MAPEPPSGIAVTRDESLSAHTYFRIGGPAQFFATPDSIEELQRLAAWAAEEALPLRVLGGGSNVLVADAGVSGLVVSLRAACSDVEIQGAALSVGAAVMLPSLARTAAERGLGGLEFAIGIPGSIGGALQSNAGIGDGREIGALVRTVDVLADAEVRTLNARELSFGYRQSSLRESGAVVLGAMLELHERPRDEVEADMRQLLEARAATQPTAGPNAGSMFRNPPGDYAGRVIEAAGCKGLASGAASVSDLHANFIVHDGEATAANVASLMSLVQQRVRDDAGLWLQPEIEWWGDGQPPEPWRDAPDDA